nr:immunoglobulin heavy chain junction region [Macaca mulatta]MOV47507.1 immunoglobulin heavy chain junction region [Macaca mulatta]MOV48127.1 immunoglobulin heavy chain junction region [Macaca mulatta]
CAIRSTRSRMITVRDDAFDFW